jgi:hypothetical protein
MNLIFMAHPVGGDVSANLARAKRWLRWLQDKLPDDSIIAPWISYCEVHDDADPVERERGIRRNLALIERCDRVVLVGGRISEGMQREAVHAAAFGAAVVNWSHLGGEPPTSRG